MDAGVLDGNDEWRAVGISRAGNKSRCSWVYNHADEQRTENIKESNAVAHAAGSPGDGLMRILSLGGSDDDSLDSDEAERSVDESGQEAEEVPRRTRIAVEVRPRPGIVPVAKATALVVGATSCRDDNGHDHQAQEAENLDAASNNFGVAVEANAHEIDGQDERQATEITTAGVRSVQ